MQKSIQVIKHEEYCRICGKKLKSFGTTSAHSSTFNQELCYDCIEENIECEAGNKKFYLIIPSITKLEHDVIINGIGKSDFFDNCSNGMVWSDDLIDTCEITTSTQLPGVVSSLVKKGLVSSNEMGVRATLQLTAEGYTYFLTHRNMKERYHLCEEVHCVSCGELVTFPNFNGIFSNTLNGELCYHCIESKVKNPDSKDFNLVIPNVTELEHDVIMNGIAKDEAFNFCSYGDVPNGIVPTNVLVDNCEKTTAKQISGVMSSLIKKRLVISELLKKGYDNAVQLTAEGYTYYLSNRGDSYDP